ncbi:MAG: carboxylesterase family protein [Microthrixaceae bacterium]
MLQTARAHREGGAPVYVYRFDEPATGMDGTLGAAHAVEIPYTFDNLDRRGVKVLLGEIDDRRRRVAADIADRWVDFAAGRPLTVPGSEEAWPLHDPTDRRRVVIGAESHVAEGIDDAAEALWMVGDRPAGSTGS